MVRDTSIMAYHDLVQSGAINDMQREVMIAFLADSHSTDKEISEKHDIEINIVTARRNELVTQGIMSDEGQRECTVTGRLAHIWRVRSMEEIRKGKPKSLGMLKDSEMQKIHKKILQANDFQKKKIIQWCQEKNGD